MKTLNFNSSQGPDEEVLLKTFRLSAPSPERKARAMKAAREAWRAAPALRHGATRWWYPILELAAAGVILLVGSQINGFLISSGSSFSAPVGMTLGSLPDEKEDAEFCVRIPFHGGLRRADSFSSEPLKARRGMLDNLLRDEATEAVDGPDRQNSLNGSSCLLKGLA
jgi:hypothetical protein